MTPDRWEKIEQLFHAAHERAANDRAAFLRDACAGDDSLLREIESLLAQETATNHLLEVPALEAAKMLSKRPGQSFIGRQVGSYHVISLLGVGGMGEVYEARDAKLERCVAIKILPASFANDPERVERFLREARMLASLNHPNIATIHGFEKFDGLNYLIMELIPGQTLAERIAQGALPLDETLNLARQIAEALEAAHKKGVIHRDLKPANVKVTPEGRVKVLDFGLAKTFTRDSGRDVSQASTLSQGGLILGTPAYMSPEQAAGKPVDKRTDIWAFGCVCYEMLTGQRAFRGDSIAEIIAKTLEREPDWQLLPTSTPSNVRDLLRLCLQKDPQRRVCDLGDARIEIQPAPHRSIAPTEPMQSLAVLPLENLSGDANQEYFADGMTDELITNLVAIEGLRVISRTSVMRYKKLKKPLAEIARELRVSHLVDGSVLRAGRRVRITAQLIDAATDRHLWAKSYERDLRDILALQSEVARAIAGEIQVKLTPAARNHFENRPPVNPHAYETYLKARYYANRVGDEGTRQAVEYLEQAIAEDPDYAQAHALLAASYAIVANFGVRPAKEVMPKAKTAALRALEIDARLAEAHTSLGVVNAFYEYDWQEAERRLKAAIELDVGASEVHHWYAHYLLIMGRLEEALAEFQRACDLDPFSPTLNNDVAQTLYLMGGYDESIEQSRRTLELDAHYAWTYANLAQAYEQKGRNAEAIAEAQKAVAISQSPRWLSSLGYQYAAAGKKYEAQRVLDEMNALSERRYVSPFEFATVYVGLNEKEQALECLGKAYEARNFGLILLKVDPMFNPLRTDERFRDLLHHMNLPL